MIFWICYFSIKVEGSCSLFNVDCQSSGALVTLVRRSESFFFFNFTIKKDTDCYEARNSSEKIVSANLTDAFFVEDIENGTIRSECALSNFQLLEYSKCFTSNISSTSLNYTSHVVESLTIENTTVILSVIEEIFCEPEITLKISKCAIAGSSSSFKGNIPVDVPDVNMQLTGFVACFP